MTDTTETMSSTCPGSAYVILEYDITDLLDSDDDSDELISGVKCAKCDVYLEPHTEDEHLDINHKVHKCEGGHRR